MTDPNPAPPAEGLRACPFCGVVPVICEDDSYGNCSIGCGCEHEPCVQLATHRRDELVTLWNIRAPDPDLSSLTAENERLKEALTAGERFLDKCNSAWAAGEPTHRVRAMLDAADTFRAALSSLPAIKGEGA